MVDRKKVVILGAGHDQSLATGCFTFAQSRRGSSMPLANANAGFNLPDSLFAGDTSLISSATVHLNWMVGPFLNAQPEMRKCC